MAQERSDMTGADLANISDEMVRSGQDLSAADDTTSHETEKIREKIEGTRAQMGETIDAIQERLSYENISGQVSEHVNIAVATAKEAVYDATIGRAVIIMKNIGNEISATSIGRTIKSNPLPFILIGAGAGMLAYKAFNGGENRRSGRRSSDSSDRQLSGGIDGSVLSSVTDSVAGTLGGVRDSVTSAAGTAYDKVTGVVDQTYRKAGELGSTAREQYDHYLEENPLAVGAVALALGAAVGLALPATRYEGKLMGPAKRDLLNKAQDTAANLLHETRESVGDAGRAFADKAKASIEH